MLPATSGERHIRGGGFVVLHGGHGDSHPAPGPQGLHPEGGHPCVGRDQEPQCPQDRPYHGLPRAGQTPSTYTHIPTYKCTFFLSLFLSSLLPFKLPYVLSFFPSVILSFFFHFFFFLLSFLFSVFCIGRAPIQILILVEERQLVVICRWTGGPCRVKCAPAGHKL